MARCPFVEIEEWFSASGGVVGDPTEERIKSEFENVKRSYVPCIRCSVSTKSATRCEQDHQFEGNVAQFRLRSSRPRP